MLRQDETVAAVGAAIASVGWLTVVSPAWRTLSRRAFPRESTSPAPPSTESTTYRTPPIRMRTTCAWMG